MERFRDRVKRWTIVGGIGVACVSAIACGWSTTNEWRRWSYWENSRSASTFIIRVTEGGLVVEHTGLFRPRPTYAAALANGVVNPNASFEQRTAGDPDFSYVLARESRIDHLLHEPGGADRALLLRVDKRLEVDNLFNTATVLRRRSVTIPLLLISVLSLWPALAAWIGWSMRRRFRRARNSRQCVGCDYDLIATPDLCPECGRPANAPLPTPSKARVGVASGALLLLTLMLACFTLSWSNTFDILSPRAELDWFGVDRLSIGAVNGSIEMSRLPRGWSLPDESWEQLFPGWPAWANASRAGSGPNARGMRVAAAPFLLLAGCVAVRLGRWRLGFTKTSRRGGRPGGEGTGPGSFRAASSRT